MAHVPADDPLQVFEACPVTRHAAAVGRVQGNHAVHLGKFLGHLRREGLGDEADQAGRAVASGQHRDVVPGGDPAVRAHDAVKGGNRFRNAHRRRPGTGRRGAFPVKGPYFQVVVVHMPAFRDVHDGEPDHLAVLVHHLVPPDVPEGDLVPGRNGVQAGEAGFREGRARRQGRQGHGHAVALVQYQV